MTPAQRVFLLDLSRDLAAARVKAGTIAGTFEPSAESALLYLIGDGLSTLARRTDAILETDALYQHTDRTDLRVDFCWVCGHNVSVRDDDCVLCGEPVPKRSLKLVTPEKRADAKRLATAIRSDWDAMHGMDEVI